MLSINEQLLLQDVQQYLRINTAHPTPAYAQAITFLQSLAERDGFEHKTIILPSGLPVLIISYFGNDSTLPALALNHHIDVVPVADESQWQAGPFSGTLTDDGRIIGRGTQDMKGVGMIHYHALRELKQLGNTPGSIHILCVPDEEKGGFNGVKQLIETEEFRQLKIGYVLDEGRPSGNDEMLYIKVDERKPLQVRICAKGQPAHGSKLLAENAAHRLIEFLYHIVAMHKEQQKQAEIVPVGLLLSAQITSLASGFSSDSGVINVVPEVAYATIDVRIPPGMKIRAVEKELDRLCAEGTQLSYEIIAAADERLEVPAHNILFEALSIAARKNGCEVAPLYSEGASDMRYYHKAGMQGVGFTPFSSEDNLHGTNESITLKELIKGKNIMSDFIKSFCFDKEL